MPITLQGFTSTDWARAANTTLTKYVREVENDVLRNYQIGALLEANGRVSYNNTGRGIAWPTLFRLHRLEGNTGETVRQFNRMNPFKLANLEQRGYQVTDYITKKELIENSGPEAIINVWNGFTDRLKQSMTQGLGPEYYVDGYNANNTTGWHGLESVFGTPTNTISVSDGSVRTANAADFVGSPPQTYAGIVCALGTYGGDQESGVIWPKGLASPEYDFWSPLIINYNSTGFSASTHNWANQAAEALRFGIIHSQRNTNANGQITNIMLDRELYRTFLSQIDSFQKINVERNQPNGLVALGFKNTVIFDNVEVSWEAAVPSNVGYGLSYQNCELMGMESDLFTVEGPEYDMRQQAHIAVVSTLSNLKFASPRNFVKWMNVT
mgnify:CR=1 FL=1